jgi:hypothetical protein
LGPVLKADILSGKLEIVIAVSMPSAMLSAIMGIFRKGVYEIEEVGEIGEAPWAVVVFQTAKLVVHVPLQENLG